MTDDRKLADIGIQLSELLERLSEKKSINMFDINCNYYSAIKDSMAIDMKKLCIIRGQYCWNVLVDLLVSLFSFHVFLLYN